MSALMNDYETKYRAMRVAAVEVNGDLFKMLVKKCQENDWLKVRGIDFEPDGLCCESDYPYYLERYDDIEMLKAFFNHGNWGIRAAVQYRDLIFVNQVNGGDEWWTLKIDGDKLVAFESITFRPSIQRKGPGNFNELIESMVKATVEQCKALKY